MSPSGPRIRNPGSGIRNPGSRIWDPESEIWGLGSGKKHILDPKSRGQKGVGSWIRIFNCSGGGGPLKVVFKIVFFPFYHKLKKSVWKTEYSSVWIQITEEIIMDPDPQSRNPDLWIRIQ
jgi:hypothetical protein